MSIEAELASRLKDAMRAKNQKELGVLRMVKSEAQAQKSAPGFTGETDDGFYTAVIASYVKKQKKALKEFQKAGDAGLENAAGLEYEISYLEPFLPKLKGEVETRKMVKAAIEETGASGAKMMGKVIGWVMKSHKDEVDAALVKRIALEELK